MGFRLKIIISYAAVIFLTLLLSLGLFAFLAQQIQQGQRQAAEERLSRQTLVVQDRINRLCPPGRVCGAYLEQYRRLLLDYAGLLDARILMVDERGIVQVDTDTKTATNLEDKKLSSYKLVERDNKPHLGSIKLNDINYIYYALPGPGLVENRTSQTEGQSSKISLTEQVVEIKTDLVLNVPQARLEPNWNNLVGGMLLAGLTVLSLAVVAAVFIGRSIARPLISMTRVSEAIAQGDYSQQLPERKGHDKNEMGRLAVSFNRMAREVAKSQQTMRDFVANVSHELKTPLTSIQGYSQAIVDGTADDRASLDRSASVINHEAARMRRLVDELLDLSRIESGQIELVRRELDLEKLLQRLVSILGPQAAEKGIRIHAYLNLYRDRPDLRLSSYNTSGPIVMGDSDRLEQIFTNILDNAIKYSPDGGEISLVLRLSEAESGRVAATSNHAAGRYYWATIEISNHGPVISPDQLPRIFERFYKLDKSRARRRGESTGLGLAIAKELIEAHKGTIEVTSVPLDTPSLYPVALPTNQPQEGLTTFTISLPVLALPAVNPYQPTAL